MIFTTEGATPDFENSEEKSNYPSQREYMRLINVIQHF